MIKFLRIAVLLLTGAGAVAAPGPIRVALVWGEAQRFELERSLAPGQTLEVCGELHKGQPVEWSFHGDSVLGFAILHREGKRSFFDERRARTRGITGRFEPSETQDYCWQWRNGGTNAARMALMLRY